jgi:hypothetical protein
VSITIPDELGSSINLGKYAPMLLDRGFIGHIEMGKLILKREYNRSRDVEFIVGRLRQLASLVTSERLDLSMIRLVMSFGEGSSGMMYLLRSLTNASDSTAVYGVEPRDQPSRDRNIIAPEHVKNVFIKQQFVPTLYLFRMSLHHMTQVQRADYLRLIMRHASAGCKLLAIDHFHRLNNDELEDLKMRHWLDSLTLHYENVIEEVHYLTYIDFVGEIIRLGFTSTDTDPWAVYRPMFNCHFEAIRIRSLTKGGLIIQFL